jgi:hypothetical protein
MNGAGDKMVTNGKAEFMPKWQSHRETLNRLPIRHESWGY